MLPCFLFAKECICSLKHRRASRGGIKAKASYNSKSPVCKHSSMVTAWAVPPVVPSGRTFEPATEFICNISDNEKWPRFIVRTGNIICVNFLLSRAAPSVALLYLLYTLITTSTRVSTAGPTEEPDRFCYIFVHHQQIAPCIFFARPLFPAMMHAGKPLAIAQQLQGWFGSSKQLQNKIIPCNSIFPTFVLNYSRKIYRNI